MQRCIGVEPTLYKRYVPAGMACLPWLFRARFESQEIKVNQILEYFEEMV